MMTDVIVSQSKTILYLFSMMRGVRKYATPQLGLYLKIDPHLDFFPQKLLGFGLCHHCQLQHRGSHYSHQPDYGSKNTSWSIIHKQTKTNTTEQLKHPSYHPLNTSDEPFAALGMCCSDSTD